MENLTTFFGALTVVYLLPGPDMVLILQTTATKGRLSVLATICGLAMARAIHVTLASVGLASILKATPQLFEIMRWGGSFYLMWLGWKILSSPLQMTIEASGASSGNHLFWPCVWKGLATNGTNPKALLFCSLLLPQFVDTQGANGSEQFLLLGAMLVAVGLGFDCLFSVVGSTMRSVLERSNLARQIQRWTFGSLMIGFGLRLSLG